MSIIRRVVYINPPIGFVESILKVKSTQQNTSHRIYENEIGLLTKTRQNSRSSVDGRVNKVVKPFKCLSGHFKKPLNKKG